MGGGKMTLEQTIRDAKFSLFCDLWDKAWVVLDVTAWQYKVYGKYDPENAPDPEHPFFGNKLWMTYEEAVQVIVDSWGRNKLHTDSEGIFRGPQARTLLPLSSNTATNLRNCIASCPNLETIRFMSTTVNGFSVGASSQNGLGTSCNKLKIILGVLDFVNKPATEHVFSGGNVEEVWIRRLCSSQNAFSYLKKLKCECWQYMVDNATNTTEIQVCVHKDVYAALSGTYAKYPFNEGTQEEWTQLMNDAISRQIAFYV